MITIEPILLDVDVSTEDYDLDMDMSINVTRLEGGSLPQGGNAGDIIIKRSETDYDCEWVAPANEVEQDNTRPITAAAVYTTVGNINALLATI